MFHLKKNLKYFSFIYILHKKVDVVVQPAVFEVAFFCDVLRVISHIDFKCDRIHFHNQRKQQAKYQHLDSDSLIMAAE